MHKICSFLASSPTLFSFFLSISLFTYLFIVESVSDGHPSEHAIVSPCGFNALL